MGWKVWGLNPCGARFSASDQSSRKACLASCAVGNRSPSKGVVKWPGHGVDHPSQSSDDDDDDDMNEYSCNCTPLLCLHGILWDGLYLDLCEYSVILPLKPW